MSINDFIKSDSQNTRKYGRYDKLARYFLGKEYIIADIIKTFVDQKYSNDINYASLSYNQEYSINTNLNEFITDIRLTSKSISNPELEYGFLIILEHQSDAIDYMAFRFLQYTVNFYSGIASKYIPNKQKFTFPFPINILLHQGEPWGKFKYMRDLIVGAENFPDCFLGTPIVMIDLAELNLEEQNCFPEIKALLWALQSGATNKFDANLNFIINNLSNITNKAYLHNYTKAFISFALSIAPKVPKEQYLDRFSEIIPKAEVDNMYLSIIDQERAEAAAKATAIASAATKADSIITLLQLKFTIIDQKLKEKIKSCYDLQLLDKIFIDAFQASSIDEFIKESTLH
jgi:hypothetical protein